MSTFRITGDYCLLISLVANHEVPLGNIWVLLGLSKQDSLMKLYVESIRNNIVSSLDLSC